MSYLRDAMKRPTNSIPDHGWQDQSDSTTPDRGLQTASPPVRTADPRRKRASHSTYEAMMTDTHDSYVHLTRSMLVRLNIQRSNGDSTPVLCVSQEVKHTGLKMRLPCRLALAPGAVLDIELFTLFRDAPVAVKAVVQNVVRTVGEDIVRYMVEVKFKSLTPPAEHEINAFIHAAQLDERRMMLA